MVNRAAQDEFAYTSHMRAAEATKNNAWKNEIIAVEGHDEDGILTSVDYDEVVRPETTVEALAKLRPVFNPKAEQ